MDRIPVNSDVPAWLLEVERAAAEAYALDSTEEWISPFDLRQEFGDLRDVLDRFREFQMQRVLVTQRRIQRRQLDPTVRLIVDMTTQTLELVSSCGTFRSEQYDEAQRSTELVFRVAKAVNAAISASAQCQSESRSWPYDYRISIENLTAPLSAYSVAASAKDLFALAPLESVCHALKCARSSLRSTAFGKNSRYILKSIESAVESIVGITYKYDTEVDPPDSGWNHEIIHRTSIEAWEGQLADLSRALNESG